jgi:sarcosine oxidase subunit beta
VINRMAGVESGMSIKTRALRREVHHVPAPQGFNFEKDGVMTSDGDLYLYFRPETGNKMTIGSGDPPCDPQTWVDDPDNFNREFTESQWQAQVYRAARRVPSLPIPNQAQGVVDLYDVSDDWIPIYDRSDLDGFYLAIGTSGHQFKNAGVVGDLMADLIDACEQGHDHDASPVQFRCRYTGFKINTGTFSRRRGINKDSSFSVRG